MIAWPFYVEQKMNTVLVANDLKVAMRVKVNDKGLVTQRHRKLRKKPNWGRRREIDLAQNERT